MNIPKISVIVPVYGVEKYIKDCLESLKNQTLKEIEIIIVNDGTKDNSMEIVKNYLSDKRIKVINKKNGGLSSARNLGIESAMGEYIYNLDSDDFIEKDTLEKCYEYATKNNLDVVIFNVKIYLEEHKTIDKIWKDTNLSENKIYSNVEYLEEYFLGNGCPAIWNKVFKSNLYKKNNIFHPENINYGEDASTMTRLILQAKRIGILKQNFYTYRIRKESMMQKDVKISDYLTSYKITEEYLKKNNFKILEKYLNTYKFWYVYNHLFKKNYRNLIKEKEGEEIEIYKLFFKEIKNMKICNRSLKQRILILSYKLNINLGNLIVDLSIFIKKFRKIKIF